MKLSIMGDVYKLVQETSLLEKEMICGECDFQNKLIKIDASLTGQMKDETIIHELIHAALHRLSWRQAGLMGPLEELLADQLAKVISENFKLSPRVKSKRAK